MKKALKLIIGGTILGGLGYIFLGNPRQNEKVQSIERVFSLGREILTMEIDPPTSGGMTRSEYVDMVATLYRELPTMASDKDIENVREHLEILAKADRKWSVLSSIFNEGTSMPGDTDRAKKFADAWMEEEEDHQNRLS